MAFRKKAFSRPELKWHKQPGRTGEACVYFGGERYPLGPWNGKGTPPREVLQKYLRTVEHLEAVWRAEQAQAPQPAAAEELILDEAIASYLWALEHEEDLGDLRADGTISSHFERAKTHLKPVSALYGDCLVSAFGTRELKACRQAWRKASWWALDPSLPAATKQRPPKPWGVTYSNTAQQNVIRFFSWLEAEGLAPAGKVEHLKTLGPLKPDHSYEAPTVAQEVVELTVRYTSPQIAAMARLQAITAMRPGELVAMTRDQIDTRRDIWVYHPGQHKGKWRGKKRLIPLSRERQEILQPFLDRPVDAPLFSPAEAAAWWRQERSAAAGQARKTPIYPSELKARARKRRNAARRKPRKGPGDHYTQHSYRQAIDYAIEKARAAGHLVPDWKPYAIRHARITEVQLDVGWEEAQAVAGHESPATTARYAHERFQRALRIAAGTQTKGKTA